MQTSAQHLQPAAQSGKGVHNQSSPAAVTQVSEDQVSPVLFLQRNTEMPPL